MNVELRRADVAAKFETTVTADISIRVACYSGKLSNINMCGAETLVKLKFPALKLKAPESTPDNEQ